MGLHCPVSSAFQQIRMSGKDGTFTVSKLRPGAWLLQADADGLRQIGFLRVFIRDGSIAEVNIQLSPSKEIGGIVVDEEGSPAGGVWIWLEPVDENTVMFLEENISRTEEDGTFFINGLVPGLYRLSVEPKGFAESVVESVEAGAGDVRITLRRK